METIKISPSLLSADWLKLGQELDNLFDWGADMVHCDVIDGIFAPNITFGMPMIRALKKTSKLPLDVHLMIIEPERYIDEFIAAGSHDIAFHPEASKQPHELLRKIANAGVKAGIALNPDVPVSIAAEFIDEIDFGELRLGLETQFTPNVNVWFEGHHHTGSNDYESSGAMVGFKYQW